MKVAGVDLPGLVLSTSRAGKPKLTCIAMRCASKGNTVTAAHQHTWLAVEPVSNERRLEIYTRDRRTPSVRQARQLRRMARRAEHRGTR